MCHLCYFSELCDCDICQDFEFVICFNSSPHSKYLLLNLICIHNAELKMTVKASGPIKPGSTDAHESQVSDLLTRMMTVETCFQRKKNKFQSFTC